MVSPAKMDPSYKPSATPGHDLRSGWSYSPPKPAVSLQRQKSAPPATINQRGGHLTSLLSASVEGPALGMFPTKPLDTNLKVTQLHPIPLSFSRFARPEIDTSARSANSYPTGTTKELDSSPLGMDIRSTLPTAAPKPARRMTRSSITMQPDLNVPQVPVGNTWTPEQQLKQLVDAQDLAGLRASTGKMAAQSVGSEQRRIERKRASREKSLALAAESKGRKNTGLKAAEPYRTSVGHTTAPSAPVPRITAQPPLSSHLERIQAGLSVVINQTPKHLERVVANPQVVINQVPKHLERTIINSQVVVNGDREGDLDHQNPTVGNQYHFQRPENPIENALGPKHPERVTGDPLVATDEVQKHLEWLVGDPKVTADYVPKNHERITGNAPVAVDHTSSVKEDAILTSRVTPERPVDLTPCGLSSPFREDPTNPNVGMNRPGAESPVDFGEMDAPWIFEPSRSASFLIGSESTPELGAPSPYSIGCEDVVMEEAGTTGERISGSTLTSYSQRAGSPTSLISMYRVHGGLRLGNRKGMSLIHTKRPYIGEGTLLDLDMPKRGGDCLMDIAELDGLMDEMMNGEPGTEVKLASVDRDKENGGRYLTDPEPVKWR